MRKRFEIISNSEVLDLETGLIWQKQPSQKQMNYLEAERYPDKLVQDWRLPTINELSSLIDYDEANPSLPVGHTFVGVRPSWYWSSSPVKMYQDNNWLADFHNGNVDWSCKNGDKVYVWLVRDN